MEIGILNFVCLNLRVIFFVFVNKLILIGCCIENF